jgi:16S rRNA (guanine966-N2)-methyltransferase
LRIISGKYKGKRINAPKNIKARPTTDFAKEGLFNILVNSCTIEDANVLDLFCGTGNISLEFASRGATKLTAVDIAGQSVRFVSKMGQELDLNIKTIKSDVFRFLQKHHATYDIIFADPPYDHEKIADIPKLVFENNLLDTNGMLIVEHGEYTDLSKSEHFREKRTYGKVNFSFFYPLND